MAFYLVSHPWTVTSSHVDDYFTVAVIIAAAAAAGTRGEHGYSVEQPHARAKNGFQGILH